MRLPWSLAWPILVLVFFTAALLRQFHDRTPVSPLAPPFVGSLLFALVFLLLLVSAREWRKGAVTGPGVRLGSLTPLLLMLLIEKWISITVYPAAFRLVSSEDASPALLDAQFRAFAGLALIGVCLLLAPMSRPTARKTWRRARPSRWPGGALAVLVVVTGSYVLLGGLSWLLGARFRLDWPMFSAVLVWVLVGQALLAFAEELYYRGLLMSEVERLAPRLGIRGPSSRRWMALLFTAFLFGFEHLRLGPPWEASARQLIFTVALGLLLGILVMVSANLHFTAGVHAWINWLLLGAAPRFALEDGRPALPPGTYIGITLILAFVLAFALHRWRRHPPFGQRGELMEI